MRSLKAFFGDRRGTIFVIFAASLPAILTIVGGGVDYARAVHARLELTRALESGVLAAASLTNTQDIETVVREYVEANIETGHSESWTLDVDSEVTINSKEVTATSTLTVDTYFLGLLSIDTIDVAATATAIESRQHIEISLVLDISSSMIGAKLSNLKDAASEFVDGLLEGERADITSINVIPFGGSVNVQPLFNYFAVDIDSSTLNPGQAQYDIGPSLQSGDFRFNAAGGHENENFCLEHVSSDFDNGSVFALESKPQLPHFWKWYRFNPWCPEVESSIVLNSNQPDVLSNHIRGMTLSDGTGMDIGTMWGYKMLQPAWRGYLGGDFPERPQDFSDDVIKVLVVMTDGNITSQLRPEDPNYFNVHTNRPKGSTATSQFNRGNNRNEQLIVNRGNAASNPTNDVAAGYFKRVCDLANREGIQVYTIGFQIGNGSMADDLLEYCATDNSKYFFVESLDISSAFEAIAASVNALRVSG